MGGVTLRDRGRCANLSCVLSPGKGLGWGEAGVGSRELHCEPGRAGLPSAAIVSLLPLLLDFRVTSWLFRYSFTKGCDIQVEQVSVKHAILV